MRLTLACLILLCAACTKPQAASDAPQAKVSSPMRMVDAAPANPAMRQTLYVPVYSSIHWGLDQRLINLAATLSVRNVSRKHPIYLTKVEYYDSAGKKLRDYLKGTGELGPLATTEFVVEQRDVTGGPGANFLVEWTSAATIDTPIVESVMIGQLGAAGISFTSPAKVLTAE
ncbi:MAG: DUF3124 domain-containing protein [Bryobacterales bacterium]|nr:DUF3124 domain-containing protein [Bryobacterales bacterium]